MSLRDFYKSVGIDLEEKGSQLLGECPFCGKAKFYVDEQRTVYSCRVCGASGNQNTIMGQLFEKVYRPAFKEEHRLFLSKFRGIPKDSFDHPNLGYIAKCSEVVLVVRKADGKAISLRRLARVKKKGVEKHIWMNVPLGVNWLIGIEHVKETDSTIYVCEGEWDFFALRWAFRKAGKTPAIVAVPGAANHPAEWKPYFDNREVVTLYDNDEPGRQGCFGLKKKVLKGTARVSLHLHWDQEKPEGYDIHDLVKENKSDPSKVVDYIKANVKSSPQGSSESTNESKIGEDNAKRFRSEEEEKSLEPMNHGELHKVFHKWLVLNNTDMIDVVMGTLWATYLPGDPLWMMFVAASGGGKSETLMSVTPWSKCYDASSMTPHSLASGFPGDKDVSLLAKLEGRQAAVVIKDLTPMMKNGTAFDEIIGIFRDAYDGHFVKVFGNGITRRYNDLNFGMLVGVTTIIDKYDSVALGERFVKFRPEHELNRDDDAIFEGLMAKGNMDLTKMRPELREACLRCLARKFKPENIPEETMEFKRFTWHLASICAKLRAAAPMNEWTGRQEAVPMSEPPFRLQKQFIKLSKGLALHFGAKSLMDPRIVQLVRRVAVHTPNIMCSRIAKILFDRHNGTPVEIRDIVELEPSLKPDTVREVLDKLCLTKCVERFQTAEAKTVYRLEERLYDKLDHMSVFKGLPKCDPLYRRQPFKIKKASNE